MPASRAARMVTILKVVPGGYCDYASLFISGLYGLFLSSFQ